MVCLVEYRPIRCPKSHHREARTSDRRATFRSGNDTIAEEIKKFIIQVKKEQPNSSIVDQVRLNNRLWKGWQLPFERLVEGGILDLKLKGD